MYYLKSVWPQVVSGAVGNQMVDANGLLARYGKCSTTKITICVIGKIDWYNVVNYLVIKNLNCNVLLFLT